MPKPPAETPTAKSDSSPVKLLDYACGTGAITKALGPYVNSVRGIDISENMVAQYNAAARASGLTQQQVYAVVGDLCAQAGVPEPLLAPTYYNFDIAAICLGFHHFESPPLAVRRLVERLKPGSGVLLIIDFLPSKLDTQQHGQHGQHAHAVTTTGFTREEMRKLYADAGVTVDFGFDVLPEPAVIGDGEGAPRRQLFIAKGRRAEKPQASRRVEL